VVVEKGMENKEELWYSHDPSIGAVAVGKNAHLEMKKHQLVKKSSV